MDGLTPEEVLYRIAELLETADVRSSAQMGERIALDQVEYTQRRLGSLMDEIDAIRRRCKCGCA